MSKTSDRELFQAIVADILDDPAVQALAEKEQHSKKCTRLDHCVYVAYLSFWMCRRLGLDHTAAARAGLLHDFFYEDKEDGVSRIWRHPHTALENAEGLCELSARERDIIVKHMWPLTRALPRYRESFVVGLADKLCAFTEMVRLYGVIRQRKNLQPLAATV